MSRNLGFKFFDQHFDDILANDFKVYGDFGRQKVIDLPKCFIRWYEEKFGIDLSDYKEARKSAQRDKVLARMLSKHMFMEEDFLLNDNLLFEKHKKEGIRNASF